MNTPVLGIDFGGVIRSESNGEPVENVFGSLVTLVEQKFAKRIYVVSRIDAASEENAIREWLQIHSFFSPILLSKENVHFCRLRVEKAPICESLGVTHFVDNRPEVLYHMKKVVPIRILFRPDRDDPMLNERCWFGPYHSWEHVCAKLLSM